MYIGARRARRRCGRARSTSTCTVATTSIARDTRRRAPEAPRTIRGRAGRHARRRRRDVLDDLVTCVRTPVGEPGRQARGLKSLRRPTCAGGLGATWRHDGTSHRDSGLCRGGSALLAMNQPDGFDCPGCAWPEPDRARGHRSSSARTARRRSPKRRRPRARRRELFAEHSVDELRAQSDHELGQLGRLTHPMVLRRGATTTSRSRGTTRSRSSPTSCALAGPTRPRFYTSGRTSNEAAFLYQLFGRHVRHEQLARLLEHVPRVERRRADARRSASARAR